MSVARAEKSLGKYEIRGELGRGAMGVVYRGFDPALQREVAIKTMAVSLSDAGDDETMRFHREARSAGQLRHPNIVTIYEMGEDRGIPFIAMELLEGTDLVSLLKSEELPPIARRLEIVARICDGLDFAHRHGIVHRDVKPANVFIQSNGTVKILDFGIAKLAASDATRTGTIVGTVDYMSPEQVRAERDLDGRSDVFSAGVILYELLFGRRPFQGESLASTMYRIVHHAPRGADMFDRVLPSGVSALLRGALAKDRERRFASAAEMSAACRRVAAALGSDGGAGLKEGIARALEDGLLDASLPEAPRDAPGGNSTRTVTNPGGGAGPGVSKENRSGAASNQASRLLWPAGVAVAGLGVLLAAWAMSGGEPAVVDAPDGGQRAVKTAAAREGVPAAEHGPGPDSDGVVEAGPSPSEPLEPAAPAARSVGEEAQDAEVDRSGAGGAGNPAAAPADPVPAAVVAPPPPGVLAVGVVPWARLEKIENLDTGEVSRPAETTPVRLELSPGRYRLTLAHPDAEGPLRVEAIVTEGSRTVLSETMPGFGTDAMLGALFASRRAD